MIDVASLITSSYIENGFVVIFNQYCETYPEPSDNTYHYSLRVALRAIGHKITKHEKQYDDNCNCSMKKFFTTITEQEGELITKLWNEYIDETEREED